MPTAKPAAYLETTIISYIAARRSRDVIAIAHQDITRTWWESYRNRFDIFVSEIVVQEAGAGNPEAAARRLNLLADISLLEIGPLEKRLAEALVTDGPIPASYAVDALHIAVAAAHGMDYLLTWNCTHIANAAMRKQVERVCRSHSFEPPVICTPAELMED
jgi:predicted nucleic acid-binding protein